MPFTTVSGGFCFDDGVVLTHKDENKQTIRGNGLAPQFLTNISAVGLDSESEEFRMAVIRGQPRPNGTSWETTPVFIIQHYDFDDATWKRFLDKFEKTLIPGATTPSFSYEPAVYDVTDLEYGRREMPLWVIKHLDSLGVIDSAVNETKVQSRAPKLTSSQLDLIRKTINNRIALEESSSVKVEEAPEASVPSVAAPKAVYKKKVLQTAGTTQE